MNQVVQFPRTADKVEKLGEMFAYYAPETIAAPTSEPTKTKSAPAQALESLYGYYSA